MPAIDPGPVRFSHLRAYGRSPAHGHHARFRPEDDPTRDMQRGTAVHALLFGTRKVIGYGSTRAGRKFDEFAADHPDHEILTMSEYDKACRMADAVRSSVLANEVLAGQVEQTILFRWMDMECRATPDVRGREYVTELKTTANADPNKFRWHALRMHYHAQMRMQCMAVGRLLDCNIVCVEASEPHPVTVFRWTDRALEVGEKLLFTWMERLRNCEQSKSWPPYSQSLIELDVPDEVALEFGDDDDIGNAPGAHAPDDNPFGSEA